MWLCRSDMMLKIVLLSITQECIHSITLVNNNYKLYIIYMIKRQMPTNIMP